MKRCTRCGGQVLRDHDKELCLQCGYTLEVVVPIALVDKDGKPKKERGPIIEGIRV